MNKKPNHHSLVSVIMNCYNGEAYLRQSIESVISQTYEDWELIFWDNRSEDNSAEIFKSYKDNRLKYYHAPQHNILYAARNEAIKKASGEFIAFLDTDDFWKKNKLELQMPLFQDPKVGVVYGNLHVINQKLNTKKIFLKKKKPKGYILTDLLKNYCTGLVTLVIRKSFLENFKPAFNSKFHIIGDFDLMIRMSAKYKFDCVDKPIASYRVHEKNESLLKKKIQIDELKIWKKKMADHPNIFENKNFYYINNIINDMEIISLVLENNLKEARLLIKKMPNSLKKVKYLIALFLPNSFLKRFVEF